MAGALTQVDADTVRRTASRMAAEGQLIKDASGRYVFTKPDGEPLIPNTDYHQWKELLDAAGVREGHLHDARHTAGTALFLLGVPDVVVDAVMGWEPGGAVRMRARYMHVTGPMLRRREAGR